MKLLAFATWLVLLFMSSPAQAQCELIRRTDGLAYQTEEVYRNTNLEDGLVNIYLSFMKDSHGWHIIGTMGTTNVNDADVKPNLITFSWDNKEQSMTLHASNMSTKQDGRLHVVFSVFDLTAEQIEVLRNAKISLVLYGDTKSNGSQLITAMDNQLPKRQIECIKSGL